MSNLIPRTLFGLAPLVMFWGIAGATDVDNDPRSGRGETTLGLDPQRLVDLESDHHRLPRGTIIHELPLPHETVFSNGLLYFYHDGIFYLSAPGGFLISSPAIGTAIFELPDRHERFRLQGQSYAYAYGVFYREAPLDSFVVVDAPLGAKIAALPSRALAGYSDSTLQFAYRGTYFEPRRSHGGILYEVVEAPGGYPGDEDATGRDCRSVGIEGRFLDALSVFELTGGDYGAGVLIEAVEPGGPAEEAGLVGGSRVVEVGEETVLLGGDLLLALELPELCYGECLIDAPRLLASRREESFGAVFVRDGELLWTTVICAEETPGR